MVNPNTSELEKHEWIETHDTRSGEPFEAMLHIAREIEDMPKTRGTFTLEGLGVNASRLYEPMMLTMGAWETPERFCDGANRRFVNPNYCHRNTYASVTVECACGALVGSKAEEGEGVFEHKDCYPAQYEDARERLHKERLKWIRKAGRLALTKEDVATNMNVAPAVVDVILQDYDRDWEDFRQTGRELCKGSWNWLFDRGYAIDDIATVWRVDRDEIEQVFTEVRYEEPEEFRW